MPKEKKAAANEAASDAAVHAEATPAKEDKSVTRRSRCEACGFIVTGTKAEKICPACGAGPDVFRPFEERLPGKRARFLRLRLHPISAHVAPVFSATLFVFAAAIALAGNAPIATALVDATRILSVLLPFSILAAFLTGLADAKARMKKRTTRIFVRKIVVSALFFALSFAAAALALFTPLDGTVMLPFAALMVLCVASALYLGRSGAGLRDAAIPG